MGSTIDQLMAAVLGTLRTIPPRPVEFIFTLKMEAVRSSETLVMTYKTTRCQNPADHDRHIGLHTSINVHSPSALARHATGDLGCSVAQLYLRKQLKFWELHMEPLTQSVRSIRICRHNEWRLWDLLFSFFSDIILWYLLLKPAW
jgi:hypothetical protein